MALARWRKPAFALFLLAYFLFFNWDGLQVHFAIDDIGNMAHYYRDGPWYLLASQFLPWRGIWRPMGGLFYVPILHFAGLNPVPYQAALLLLLILDAYLIYRFARLLGCGELAAGLAALIACYHPGLANLYYNAAFVYDVLCVLFYLAAVNFYMRIRQSDRLLAGWQKAVFLALALCALNSKEMAVTIPVMLLTFEWFYHPPAERRLGALAAWLRGPGQVALMAGILTAVDLYGKLFGPQPMVDAEAYHPVFVLQRVRAFQRILLGDILFGWDSGWGGILLFWAVLAYLAWRRADRPHLRMLWWFLVITPLPIEFLVGKSEACLFVPLVGFAIFGAGLFVDCVNAAAGLLELEPGFRRFTRQSVTALLVIAAVFAWARDIHRRKEESARPRMAALGQEGWDVIQQFRAVNPHAPSGSRVAFLDDPYHSWDMLFVAELWFHDRSIRIHVAQEGPLSPQEVATMDRVFTFEGAKLVQLK